MAALSINLWSVSGHEKNLSVLPIWGYVWHIAHSSSICSLISFELTVELYSHNYSSSQLTTISSTQWHSWPTRDQVYSALPCWTLLCMETLSIMHRTLLEKYLGSEIDKNTRVSHRNSSCPLRATRLTCSQRIIPDRSSYCVIKLYRICPYFHLW